MEIILNLGETIISFIVIYFFTKFAVTLVITAIKTPLFFIRIAKRGYIDNSLEFEADIDNIANVSGAFFGSWILVEEHFLHWSIGILVFVVVASFALLKKERKLRREKTKETLMLLGY